MFKDLNLLATYSSYENDIGEEFYSPVLGESVNYDRAAAYFSAKALAKYAQGMERFAKVGNVCRFIISAEIEKDDFEQIKAGYNLKEKIEPLLISKLREDLSMEEERNMSNLAYLISLGVVDIRIAFTEKGIFHDKFGIAEDAEGEIICFRGSNNETAAAFESNYEAFDITCSWQASAFDYSKITKSKETFQRLWNNKVEHICVSKISDVVMSEIDKYNQGMILLKHAPRNVAPNLEEPNCFILDYDGELKLYVNIEDPSSFHNSKFYKLSFKRYVDRESSTDRIFTFKSEYTYTTYKKIISLMQEEANKKGYKLVVTDRLSQYIQGREFHVYERAKLSADIKNHDAKLLSAFNEYKAVVDNAFARPLREQQMWDSFFMYTMKRASNFSVPGSGKTASVLGVFAFMYSKGLADRIVMVGPKNAFGSWVDEFLLCFGNKLNLNPFSIQDYSTVKEKLTALRFQAHSANLILMNYESLRSCIDEVKPLVDGRTLLVYDEVHKVKSIEGVNAEYALKLAETATHIITLTGTPIPNSYLDIYNFLHILYNDEYNEFFGFTPQELKYACGDEINEINRKIQPFFCRTNKRQLNVPEANSDIIIPCEATNAENELFSILCDTYRKNRFALIIRLLQLESNPQLLLESLTESDFSDVLDTSAEPEDIDFIDYSDEVKSLIDSIKYTSKFSKCLETALSVTSQGKSIIIWCIFRNSIHRFETEFEKRGVAVASITGETSMEDRQAIISGFKSGNIQVLITNPHTLAESVSLHRACHDAIYFEYSYNLVHLLQSKDRIHRLGLPEGQYTQYYYMQQNFITEDEDIFSLDDRILARLNEKERIMLDAIDNNKLEEVTSSEEDLRIIFEELKL